MKSVILIVSFFIILADCSDNNETKKSGGDGEQESGWGGILNGLIESFIPESSPSEKPSQNINNKTQIDNPCPGRCVSPLASIFTCDKISSSHTCHGNLDCCIEKSVACKGVCIEDGFKSNCGDFYKSEECPMGSVCCYRNNGGGGDNKGGGLATEMNKVEEMEEGEEEEEGSSVEEVGAINGTLTKKKCRGTCRAMIFGLFLCDEIDQSADCPESHQACCVMKEKKPQHPPPEQEEKRPIIVPMTTTTTISTPTKYNSREDDSQEEVSQEEDDEGPWQTPSTTTTKPRPLLVGGGGHWLKPQQNGPGATPPGPPPQHQSGGPPPNRAPTPPPICHHYCVPLPALAYCRSPQPGTCGINAACCLHDLQPVLVTPTPTPTTTTTTTAPVTTGNELCPGQCIRPIMSFTCFLNAEMTDLFRCENNNGGEELRCCSPKNKLPGWKNVTSVNNNVISVNSYPNNVNNKVLIPQQQQAFPQQNLQPTFQQQQQPNLQQTLPQQQPLFPQQSQPKYNKKQQQRYICGIKGNSTNSRKKRVVGGRDSAPGEWCWQVALINSLNQYLCGGALIGVEWVLTAAHCVTNIVKAGEAVYVRVGDHDLTSKYGSPGAQTLRVMTTYIHHSHDPLSLDNDIALLRLSGQAVLGASGVCLICLPSRSSAGVGGNSNVLVPGRRCSVTGYGYMGESGPIPLRVREAELPIVSDGECIKKINRVTDKPFVMPQSSFCAGGEAHSDACQGDGGGPLVCKNNGGNGGEEYYELSGLVYVRVENFIGWVNSIVSSS